MLSRDSAATRTRGRHGTHGGIRLGGLDLFRHGAGGPLLQAAAEGAKVVLLMVVSRCGACLHAKDAPLREAVSGLLRQLASIALKLRAWLSCTVL